jgi:hypothetical protein
MEGRALGASESSAAPELWIAKVMDRLDIGRMSQLGAKCEILYASRYFPLRLHTRTLLETIGTSHSCHLPTFANLLGHLVGDRQD